MQKHSYETVMSHRSYTCPLSLHLSFHHKRKFCVWNVMENNLRCRKALKSRVKCEHWPGKLQTIHWW